ncbi:hypothetical protein [Lysobacter capsici]|uniref:hypothetical protein n=1 Tax=Lysobacter capsici TaxID=435897 RepID=UPI00287BAEDC|nr:hypothetical protein [Lysobacter capsici]WND82920.1 hypothetical protein RJ610_11485 [Lysobacter capsici]WND88118.1 hypothetical protein RJ609_11495 [Lysobacter capsici]
MNLAVLSWKIRERSEAWLTAMRWTRDELLVITVEFEDWDQGFLRRRVELHCHSPTQAHCQLGGVREIACDSSHPLLLSHQGPQSQLFFSSVAASAGEVYLAAHAAIASASQGWRDPAGVLCYPAERFERLLASGNGMLARGPDAVIQALAQALNGLLRVNVVPTPTLEGSEKKLVLTLDKRWVVCDSVEAIELDD